MTSTITDLMTADALWNMPDDDHRYDLIRGRLLGMPAAGGQ